jgi:hypothetical protein
MRRASRKAGRFSTGLAPGALRNYWQPENEMGGALVVAPACTVVAAVVIVLGLQSAVPPDWGTNAWASTWYVAGPAAPAAYDVPLAAHAPMVGFTGGSVSV